MMTTGRMGPPELRWWRRIDGEPSIQELLDDPVIETIMARDGVKREALLRLIDEVRDRLQQRDPAALAPRPELERVGAACE